MNKDQLAKVEQALRIVSTELFDEAYDQDNTHRIISRCTLPLISRLLDAAHADALRAAAAYVLTNYRDAAYALALAAGINAMIPERARLERELEVARAVLAEAKWWDDNCGLPGCNAVIREQRVADLEAKLEKLK